MKRSRFSEEQIIGILKKHEAGVSVVNLCRKHGVSVEHLKMEGQVRRVVSEAKRLETLEDENTRLKRLLADAMLDNAALKNLLERNGHARSQAEAVACLRGAFGMSERRAPSAAAA
ncbi:transposase [Bradyrhizobium zhanjiangense]|uniref:Transposase n=1 Tax=Bradyrhizobium zhanjiangense TaxID=1325107 RepID=A0A4Q0Q4L4_9BRAD|nr:transposase [Bradyrhizobium zhanjiangense]RXG83634.1 hypothetical protein EAS61_41600 [Bradyrhizobium zhanjiangense]